MLDLVSVIIPSYNSARFLSDTLNSVLNQTYEAIEVIVVDDGSTDETEQVAKTSSEKIRYVKQKNKGVSEARNNGFKVSKGKFICFLDADDWFYPKNIENKVNMLNSNPELGLVHGNVVVTDENLNSNGIILKGKSGKVIPHLLKLVPPAIPCPSNVLIRRKAIINQPVFDERLSTSADYDLWLRIAQEWEVGWVNEECIKYRQHGSNMFSNLELFQHDMELIFSKYPLDFSLAKKSVYYSLFLGYLKKLQLLDSAKSLVKYLTIS